MNAIWKDKTLVAYMPDYIDDNFKNYQRFQFKQVIDNYYRMCIECQIDIDEHENATLCND